MTINYDVILSPVITEKATMASEYNQVVFKVRPDASKSDIKKAVEQEQDAARDQVYQMYEQRKQQQEAAAGQLPQ